ncbi:MAG: hypothetical protein ACNS63_10215 [Candidatus Nitrospinota bacterium M3_3B_026]
MDSASVKDLYLFLGIEGYKKHRRNIEDTLGVRVNASPGLGDDRHLNPWSKEIKIKDISEWTEPQLDTLSRRAGGLARRLYPEPAYPWNRASATGRPANLARL